MKTKLSLLCVIFVLYTTLQAQQFDSLTTIINGKNIEDIASDGNHMFAALADSGVFISNDQGMTWSPCATLPDAGFGQEGAFALLVASNGDLIVGANTLFNGSPFAGVVYRSSNNGNSWTQAPVTQMGGYETADIIVELPNGDLLMKTSVNKIFKSSISDTAWTQVTTPGGVVLGFNAIGSTLFAVNNPAGGTAGIWYSTDGAATWMRYGVNGTKLNLGSVTITPILASGNYKFVGIGGTGADKGIYRSGLNDTLWTLENTGIPNNYVYPSAMTTDQSTIWMVFEGVNQCYLTSTTDFASSWSNPIGNQPKHAGSAICMKKLLVHKTHVYGFVNGSLYRIANAAQNNASTSSEVLPTAIDVFPNPITNGDLTIDIKSSYSSRVGNITISNLMGQTLYQNPFIGESQLKISVENYKAGVYIIAATIDGQTTYHKFLKH